MNGSNFCSGCGSPLDPGQPYCNVCGAKNAFAPQQPPQYIQPQYAQPGAQRSKGTPFIILSIVLFVLAAAAVALVFILGPYGAIPAELNGQWDSVLKVESVANGDTDYISKEDIGDERDTDMLLSLKKDGSGTMKIGSLLFNAVYRDGKISGAAMMNESLEVSINGTLSKTKDGFTFNGTWNYTITKGADKGPVASGSWVAVLTDAENPQTSPSASVSIIDISSLLEGSWVGDMILVETPGLDLIPGLSDSDRQDIRDSLGKAQQTLFVFKNGSIWIGNPNEPGEPVAKLTFVPGIINAGTSTFSARIETDLGNADLTGQLVSAGGVQTIQGTINFEGIPYNGVNVPVTATFTASRQ